MAVVANAFIPILADPLVADCPGMRRNAEFFAAIPYLFVPVVTHPVVARR
jgi:hypothetical protein